MAKCIESIARRHSNAVISVQDTGGNLSRARNELVERCRTPYIFLMEEDMRVTDGTDIVGMKGMLAKHKGIAGVSGGVAEKQGTRYMAGLFVHRVGSRSNRVVIVVRDARKVFCGGNLILCNLTYNWGVFRREALEECKWDERLELCEHHEFFWRLSQTRWMMACGHTWVAHTRARPSKDYSEQRKRLREFRDLEKEIVGSSFHGRASKDIWGKVARKRRQKSTGLLLKGPRG